MSLDFDPNDLSFLEIQFNPNDNLPSFEDFMSSICDKHNVGDGGVIFTVSDDENSYIMTINFSTKFLSAVFVNNEQFVKDVFDLYSHEHKSNYDNIYDFALSLIMMKSNIAHLKDVTQPKIA